MANAFAQSCVVDLCDSSDDEKLPAVVDVENSRIASSAAPAVVSLLDDGDDDDYPVFGASPKQKTLARAPEMRKDPPGQKIIAIQEGSRLDSKPAAAAFPSDEVNVVDGPSIAHRPARKRPNAESKPAAFPYNDEVNVVDGPSIAPRPVKKRPNVDSKPAAFPHYEEVNVVDRPSVAPPRPAKKRPNATLPAKPKSPIDMIYEVFPDVDLIHAQKLLFEQRNNVAMVLSYLADGQYPKQEFQSIPAAAAAAASTAIIVRRSQSSTAPKYDYLSPSSFEPSEDYKKQATEQLLYQFPFLSHKGLRRLVEQHKFHYSLVRQLVHHAIMGKTSNSKVSEEEEESHYHAMKKVLTSQRPRLNSEQVARLGHINTIKGGRYKQSLPQISDPILKDEMDHCNHQLEEWMETVEQRQKRLSARKVSQEAGTAMECSCCFGDVAIEEMVACRDEGHLFCVDCIQRYAESQIFSSGNLGTDKKTGKPALELMCCHGDGCQSAFQEAHLQKALPFKTLEKYNELQFQAAIEQAGMHQDLCTCPKCGFQADLPPTQMVFECPIEDCQFASCRKCGKVSHIPLRCDEVTKEKRQDEGRLKVEEAISEAKIRKCPKCKTPFVKTEGCNKMTCRCGVKICYICRKQVSDYSHFCQKPHCDHKKCKLCTLYSNAEEDDARAMREAGMGAAEAYRSEVLQKDQDADIQIDVDNIMQNAPPATQMRRRRKGR